MDPASSVAPTAPTERALALSLVREYLFRHGFTDTLALFDAHHAAHQAPGSPPVASLQVTTVDLVRTLRLVRVYKHAAAPFTSVLDALASVYLHEASQPTHAAPVPPVAAVVEVTTPTPAVGGGGSFWARLESAKTAVQPTPAPEPPVPLAPLPVPPVPVAAAAVVTPTPAVPVPVAPTGPSFWSRLEANKAAAPAPVAATATSTTSAPSGGGGSSSFWERMNAAKAAPPPAAAPPSRQEIFERDFTFAGKSSDTLMKRPGDVRGQMFVIRDCVDCVIIIADVCETVHVDRVSRCRIAVGAVTESLFMRNCTDCTFVIACKQLRTRDCHDCDVSVYSKTDPVIEKSDGMTLRPFALAYPGLREHFKSAALEPGTNMWRRVFDFSKDDASLRSPHLVYADDAEAWVIPDVGGDTTACECVNPVEGVAEAVTHAAHDDGLMAFDIRTTTQAAAQARVEAAAKEVVEADS